MIARYEVEHIKDIGYLLFSIADSGRQQRIGHVFESFEEARSHVPPEHRSSLILAGQPNEPMSVATQPASAIA